MSFTPKCALAALALMLAPNARAQGNQPHLAYVYPAGGRQGTSFEVTVGGQFLPAVSNAYVTGMGVTTEFLEYQRGMNGKDFNDLRDQLKKLEDKAQAARRPSPGTNGWTYSDQTNLADIRAKILKNPPNNKVNPAMAEAVLLRVTIASNAAPGRHELRLRNPAALSNPLNFYVGQLPEVTKPVAQTSNPELETLLRRLGGNPATNCERYETRIALPAAVNGQIMPGGVDRYRFRARQGEELVIRVGARALIPYLADAVPGWFEATATLYDAKGRELAYDDRFRFRPDPLLHFTVPQDGEYCVELRDSIYRGREDFVYRMEIGELPTVTDIFPLGGTVGQPTTVELRGWNLPTNQAVIEMDAQEPSIYSVSPFADDKTLCAAPFALDTLPEIRARESIRTPATAQAVVLPVIVNGRLSTPGTENVFRFEGRAGQQVVAEVLARRLDSPLDSTLELTDAAGKQLAFNDDFDDPAAGLETHHADSYLTATLPADGAYYIRLGDAQQHGGPEFSYRLRLSEPRPDFALRVTPSSLSARAGLNSQLTVVAARRDGFTNAIDLRLKFDPPGFSLSGARIPAGQDKAQITLKAAPAALLEPVALSLEGRATVNGKEIVRQAAPADDLMQAFAYRHLAPAQDLLVAVTGAPALFAADSYKILSPTPVKITNGSTTRLRVATPNNAFLDRFELELSSPPAGVTLEGVTQAAGGIELALYCNEDEAKAGTGGNLIVNVLPKVQAAAQTNAAPRPQQRRAPAGALPAIPFLIVVP